MKKNKPNINSCAILLKCQKQHLRKHIYLLEEERFFSIIIEKNSVIKLPPHNYDYSKIVLVTSVIIGEQYETNCVIIWDELVERTETKN